MESWILLWKIVFVLSMLVFASMAMLVSWRGIADIKNLIAALKDEETSD